MPVDDLWYLSKRGPDGKRLPSKRHGRGKRWRVRWTDPDGRDRQRLFDRKPDADRFDATVRADVARGTYVDDKAGRVLLREYAAQWLAAQTFDPSTWEVVERWLRLHVYPTLGGYPLGVLAARPSLIQAWVRGLTPGLAPNTACSVIDYLSAVLGAAVDDRLIGRNPCRLDSVKRPSVTKKRIVPWEVNRVDAIRQALPGQYRAMVDLGCGLGLRQGEVFGLAVDAVDWLHRVVHVRLQVKRVRGRLVFAAPKGGKERDVPLPDEVALRLSAHIKAHPPVPVTLPWREPGGKPVTATLLFTRNGQALDRNWVNRDLWKPALVAAGVIRAAGPGERYVAAREHGFHALRHSYASTLLADGVDIRTLAEYLGHHDPGFTLRTYTHLMPSAPDRARRAIDAALAGGTSPVVPVLCPGGAAGA